MLPPYIPDNDGEDAPRRTMRWVKRVYAVIMATLLIISIAIWISGMSTMG